MVSNTGKNNNEINLTQIDKSGEFKTFDCNNNLFIMLSSYSVHLQVRVKI